MNAGPTSAPKRSDPSSRGRPPKFLALVCGLIGFLAALAIGWSAGLGPALVLWRAVLVALILGTLSFGFGAVGQQVLREVSSRRAAAVPADSQPQEMAAEKAAAVGAATGPPRAPTSLGPAPPGGGPGGAGPPANGPGPLANGPGARRAAEPVAARPGV